MWRSRTTRYPATSRRREARWLAALLLSLALGVGALPAIPAQAAAPGAVLIAAGAHFDGNYQPYTWLPVTVTLENAGGNVTGDVVVEVSGGQGQAPARYFQRLELPTGSRKAVTLYAFLPNGVTNIGARFQSGKDVAEAPPVSLRPLKRNQRLIGVIGDDARTSGEVARSLLASYGGGVEAVAASPDEVPANPYGLGSFSALLVHDASTGRWSDEQRQALAGWVAQGGHLVVVGGPNWRKTAEGLGELPPVRAGDARTVVNLSGLGTLANTGRGPAGTFVVSAGDLVPGATRLAEQDGLALVAARPWGRGRVISLAFDPAAADFTGWNGAGAVWQRLALDTPLPAPVQRPFTPASNSSSSSSYAPGASSINQILRDLPSLALPPTWLLLLVMTAFIIIVGPVNYLVLRRLDRRELGWLTIPALTLVFAGAIFAFGAGTKGRAVTVNAVSIVRIAPDAALAEAQAFYGVFTPSRGVRQLRVGAGALVTGFSNGGIGDSDLGDGVRYEQGANAAARDAYFSQWTLRQVAAQAAIDPAPLALRVEVRREGPKVVGRITNTTNHPVDDVTLVYEGAYHQLGSLPAGASATVDWTPSRAGASPRAYTANLGSVLYGGYGPGGSSSANKQGTPGRRRKLLDALSGSVIAYGRGNAPTYAIPSTVVKPTPTPRPGSATSTRTPPAAGPLQVLYWHPDTPLKLDVGASQREVTTLVIQEVHLDGRVAGGPSRPFAAAGRGAR